MAAGPFEFNAEYGCFFCIHSLEHGLIGAVRPDANGGVDMDSPHYGIGETYAKAHRDLIEEETKVGGQSFGCPMCDFWSVSKGSIKDHFKGKHGFTCAEIEGTGKLAISDLFGFRWLKSELNLADDLAAHRVYCVSLMGRAERDAEEVSALITAGKKVPRSMTEDLRNHVRAQNRAMRMLLNSTDTTEKP